MGGLKPIGSEKLQGMDKIKRIMEIARFNENIPQPVNETKSTEFSANLADGNTYFIVREKSGYIIKKGLNESMADYTEPIQNRKYFSSYSQALKKLNLMAKEFNTIYENEEGTSLFSEQKKKYKLKLPGKPKAEETPAPEPVAEPAPIPEPAPAPMGDTGNELPPPPAGNEMGGELPPQVGEDMPMGDEMGDMSEPSDEDMDEVPPMDDEMGDEEKSSKKDEESSFKVIQKLTGKLAQKIRKFNSEDDMDSNDIKYVINSILSALDVDLLDDDDIEEIISRLEGDFEEGEEDKDSKDDEKEEEVPPMSDEEELPAPPEAPEGGEMKEYNELEEMMDLSGAINKGIGNAVANEMGHKLKELGEDDYGLHGARKPRHTYDHFEHGTFGESTVDKIISNYFETSENEILSEEKKKLDLMESKEKRKELLTKKIKNLSESVRQERAAFKYLERNPKSKLVGKTNKGNLVFNEGVVQTKITINGLVI